MHDLRVIVDAKFKKAVKLKATQKEVSIRLYVETAIRDYINNYK